MAASSPVRFLLSCIAFLSGLLSAGSLAAQCVPQWSPGEGFPGVSNGFDDQAQVDAMAMWDPDGAGPQAPKLVVAGSFVVAGSAWCNGLATYDPATGEWAPFGGGSGPTSPGIAGVKAIAVMANGDLVVGGGFTVQGSSAINNVARWNGTSWQPLGAGTDNAVNALAVLPTGDLVAAGWFTSAGGVAASRIARWNGTVWSPLGAGMNLSVEDLVVRPNGELFAAGSFTTAGGVTANRVARWNGASWSALGSGLNGVVNDLLLLANGNLVAGGSFTTAGGAAANNIASWNGATWLPFGSGVNGTVECLELLPAGGLVAGGWFTTAGGVAVEKLALFLNNSWSVYAIGQSALNFKEIVALPGGGVIAAGNFGVYTGNNPTSKIGRWDGSQWSALARGMNAPGLALAAMPNGDLVAGGAFTATGGAPVSYVARLAGSSWSPLGGATNGMVGALAALPNGDVVAGGFFTTIGGVFANNIARWNGATWTALGSGMSSSGLSLVNSVVVLPNGDLIAGGRFNVAGSVAADNVARWNGSAWSPLGAGVQGEVKAVAVLPNGDIIVGGSFSSFGGVFTFNLARWNGATWSGFGSGANAVVNALAVLPGGDLVVGGEFSTIAGVAANSIARWNGTSWSAFGSGMPASLDSVCAITVLPAGDLIVAGSFTSAGGLPANGIARWSGGSWSAVGAGVRTPNFAGTVRAMALRANGELAVTGNFLVADGGVSSHFARYATPCPPSVIVNGAGCAGAGGIDTLTATTMPWAGSTFRARGAGLPAAGIVAIVRGFSPVSLPLATLLPPSPVGCTLFVSPDLVEAAFPAGGGIDVLTALPNVPNVVGVALREQLVTLELDANLNFVRSTSSNALIAVIGTF